MEPVAPTMPGSAEPKEDVYEGERKEGVPHGRGTMLYADGDMYEGTWRDGKQHGQGTMTPLYRFGSRGSRFAHAQNSG